jgi:hypothetical protein
MDDRIKALLLLNAVFAPSRVWDLLRERGLPPEALWERGCDTLHREVGLSGNASGGLENPGVTTRGFASFCVTTRTTRRGWRIWRSALFFSTCGDVSPARDLLWPWWARAGALPTEGPWRPLWEASWPAEGVLS